VVGCWDLYLQKRKTILFK